MDGYLYLPVTFIGLHLSDKLSYCVLLLPGAFLYIAADQTNRHLHVQSQQWKQKNNV